MALSAFDDKAAPPTDQTLQETLGRASRLWDQLTDRLQAAYGPLRKEWNFSGKAYGWSFRLHQPKRALVYMTPCRGYFLASFALGEKACLAAHAMRLPSPVLDLIDSAPKYAEGRGVRIRVQSRRDLESVAKLAAIKVAH